VRITVRGPKVEVPDLSGICFTEDFRSAPPTCKSHDDLPAFELSRRARDGGCSSDDVIDWQSEPAGGALAAGSALEYAYCDTVE
jgi:hypothetical protein